MIKPYTKPNLFVVMIVILILLISCGSNFVYAVDLKDQKNVLIINSYNQGLAWSKDESDGIIDSLKQSDNNLFIHVENMDWKNYPTDENTEHFYDYLQYKYKSEQIDILIVTDDIALKFVLKNRESIFSNAPVVFCGVNKNGVNQITKEYDNFTGVLEEIDPTGTINMALDINPSLKNVYILFDNTESGTSTGELVINKINEYKFKYYSTK